jgi:predicted transcriptional regulator
MATGYETRLRLDEQTHKRLQEIVGRYRSNNAAIIDAINRLWEAVQEEELDAGYAAAVQENPAYPYESEDERATVRARRNARHNAATE